MSVELTIEEIAECVKTSESLSPACCIVLDFTFGTGGSSSAQQREDSEDTYVFQNSRFGRSAVS